MTHQLSDSEEDSERWWHAYQLAETNQAGELRERAEAGDEHARRQLACWLAERAMTAQAIEVIRPLADAGDDVAELWLGRWLAELDRTDELRERTAGGSYHARLELAGWLAKHGQLDELRELFAGQLELLASWLAGPCQIGDMRLLRLSAELGDEAAGERLERWLTRLRDRADAGDEYARRFLAENPDWQRPAENSDG